MSGNQINQINHVRAGLFRKAFLEALPIVFGYIPVGFAFGALAVAAGLSVTVAVAMSIFVFAGSAQFIAVGLLEAGAGPGALAVTTFLINLRHLLMSASLAPHLRRLKLWQQALFCYELTDESFAVHSVALGREGAKAAQPLRLFTVNHVSHLAWVAGTLAGAWAGGKLEVNSAALGLDYALPAMFIALLVMQCRNRRHFLIGLLAAALAVFFYLAGTGHWHIMLAAVTAAAAGAILEYMGPPERGRREFRE